VKYIMALDQGTTSSRCILFNKFGEICSIEQEEFGQIYPKSGWVEHDPEEILDSQIRVARAAMNANDAAAKDIAAIGITNQRETTVVWNKNTGEPVYNAIVWQCRRTVDMIEKLKKDGFDQVIREKTGLIADAYFSATKIKWILDNVEGARKEAEKGNLLFGTIDTWLIWKITKGEVFVTDYTNASRTMMFNIRTLQWDQEILDRFGIPNTMLASVKPSSCIYGYTCKELFGGNIAIAGAVGDQQAALFGQCCFEPGEVKNTYGTGCFLLMNMGIKAVVSKNGLITTIAASVDENVEYALEGSVFAAGAAVQWLRDELKIIQTAAETEKLAEQVEDSAGVYIVPAFTGLGAPYWDQYARGTIVGLTRGANRSHIVRATLESLAYQVHDVIIAMEQDADVKIKGLKVDGGASANNFLMQFQADILNTQVLRPKCIETTALGAAYLAGLATGYWRDKKEIRENWAMNREFSCRMKQEQRTKLLKGWKKAVGRCLKWEEQI
jgi:glycerol kinase